jgi:putative transposase
MPRTQRYEVENGWYHVFSRGAAKRHIFFNDYLKSLFINFLIETIQYYKFQIHCFCIMGNHYHLLINTPEANLSEGMCFLNSKYARAFNKHRRKDGPIFKSRFKSIYVLNERYLLNLTRYIHLNPVTSGIVDAPEKYYWSSCIDYISDISRYAWLQRDLAGNTVLYNGYINKGNNIRITEFYAKNRLPSILK